MAEKVVPENLRDKVKVMIGNMVHEEGFFDVAAVVVIFGGGKAPFVKKFLSFTNAMVIPQLGRLPMSELQIFRYFRNDLLNFMFGLMWETFVGQPKNDILSWPR